MSIQPNGRIAARLTAAGLGVAAAAYAGLVARAWYRYGRAMRSNTDRDTMLDRFMPAYDVVERHRVAVRAPADVTLVAAKNLALFQIPAVRAVFRAREIILGAAPAKATPRGLLDETRSLGWVVLEDIPGREVVMGAVTKPWEADVTFRSVAPDAFAAFDEPGYVKIVWTLRADPVDSQSSLFRTETRAVATDRCARFRFRRYWAFLSPGIGVIRWLSLGPVKAEAERRAMAMKTPRAVAV